MTFAEYNTDSNFDNETSSLEELVKIGKAEGKTKEEIRASLSPKWQKSKQINKLDSYYGADKIEAPKAEEKKSVPPQYVQGKAKDYIQKQNSTVNQAKSDMDSHLADDNSKGWKSTLSAMENASKSFKNIDDHYIDALPKFIWNRYKDGEYGKPGSKQAKSTVAAFIVDGLVNSLKAFSNGTAQMAGRAAPFADTTTMAEKVMQSNMAKGLENRWKKYGDETSNAIKLASQQSMTEQEAQNEVNKITRDNKMNTYWNKMNEDQKLYTLEVTKEIGDYIGDFDMRELANFIAGSAYKGDMTKDEVVAIGIAKLAEKTPDILGNLPEGSVKDTVMAMIGGGAPIEAVAGFAGLGGSSESKENDPNSVIDENRTGSKWTNPTGNIKGYKALDGNTYDFNTWETKAGKNKLIELVNDLDNKFYNGEINAETYRKYREPLYAEAGRHTGIKITSTTEALKANVAKKLKDLNTETKNGTVTVNDYKERSAKILEMAKDAGMNDAEIEKLKKDFKNTDKIKYKGPKK